MVRFAQTIEIKRTVPDVFEFLNTIQNYLLWMSNLIEVSASDGLYRGSLITFIQGGLGQRINLSGRVTENNNRNIIAVTGETGPIHFESSYELKSAGPASTNLTLENQINPGTFFALASPVLQHLAEVRYDADLKTLKAILEHGL